MRANHWLLVASVVLAITTGCASSDKRPTQEQRQVLTPTAKLRVAFNGTNPIYATKDAATGELKGIAVELGKELAARIGAPFEPVSFPSIGALVGSAKSGQWDVALLSIGPARTKEMDFTAPYMLVEAGYLVPAGSAISSISEVDKPGMRIAVQERGGADVVLSSTLKAATLVRSPTFAQATEALKAGKADAFAALKPALFASSNQLPGSRVLEGRFSVEEICFAVPKGASLSLSFVRQFVEDALAEGVVSAALDSARLPGALVAPR